MGAQDVGRRNAPPGHLLEQRLERRAAVHEHRGAARPVSHEVGVGEPAGIHDVVTAKKRLQMQQTTLEQSVVKLETQARQALAGGREDLARQALERKSGVQQQLQGLDGQVQQLADQQEKLVANEGELSARIESFRSQKEVMKAQYSAAEAQVRIGEASTGIGGKMADAGAAIERARAKTEEMQARAGAMDELIASGTLEDFTSDKTQLDRELAQMSSQSQVESDLDRLKQEVGKGDEQRQLEGGEDTPPIRAVPSEEKAEGQ